MFRPCLLAPQTFDATRAFSASTWRRGRHAAVGFRRRWRTTASSKWVRSIQRMLLIPTCVFRWRWRYSCGN